jgi:endogenous inhibitor of DNA gyrase (YacG/DUF329 family)
MPQKSEKKAAILRCPTCNALVLLGSEDVPFCSDRCRRIDLGKWASGDYKISSPILDPDLLEDLEHAQQQQHPTGNPKEWKN